MAPLGVPVPAFQAGAAFHHRAWAAQGVSILVAPVLCPRVVKLC